MALGLPSRDYFLHPDSEKDLEAYHSYMTDVAELLGANRSRAADELWKVVQFEQLLANVSQNLLKNAIFFLIINAKIYFFTVSYLSKNEILAHFFQSNSLNKLLKLM